MGEMQANTRDITAERGEENKIVSDYEAKKIGEVSHDEAAEILGRFNASHWQRCDKCIGRSRDREGREPARYTIPADPKRDDDLRLAAYIRQQRAKDEARDG